MTLHPSDAERVERNPWVYHERGANVADTGEASIVTPCRSGATLTVKGDFLLVLWEWDVLIEHDEGTDLHWSGRGRSAYDPVGSGTTNQFVSEDREVYLYARDAVLEVPLAPGEQVYLGQSTVEASGALTLRGATGTLRLDGLALSLQQEDAVLSGDLVAQVAHGDGGGLDVAVGGEVARVQSAITTWNAQEDLPLWSIALLAMAALAGIWLLWWLLPFVFYAKLWFQGRVESRRLVGWRARRAETFHVAALEAEWTEHPRLAVFFAGLASRSHSGTGLHIRVAQQYVRLGRHKRALAVRTRLDRVLESVDELSSNALAAADVAESLGHQQQQRNWAMRAQAYQRRARPSVPNPLAPDHTDVA